MAKYKIRSLFHGTEMKTTIKDAYKDNGVLEMLDYEVYNQGDDKDYASRKLAKIKKTLCGQPDCKCVFIAKEI